jgi:hypothetical protein
MHSSGVAQDAYYQSNQYATTKARLTLHNTITLQRSSASALPPMRAGRAWPEAAGQERGGFTRSREMRVSSDATIPTIAQGMLHAHR